MIIALLLIGFFPIVDNTSAESAYEFDIMGQSEVHVGPGGKGYVNFKLNNEANTPVSYTHLTLPTNREV